MPVTAKWHADGNIVIIMSEQGQLQCFDFALNCIKIQLLSEDITPSCVIDLSAYFRYVILLRLIVILKIYITTVNKYRRSLYRQTKLLKGCFGGHNVHNSTLRCANVSTDFCTFISYFEMLRFEWIPHSH